MEEWMGYRVLVTRREADELGIPAPMLWDLRLSPLPSGVIGQVLYVVRD